MKFLAEVFPAWLNEHSAIREYDGRNAMEAVIEICNKLRGPLIAFYANLKKGDLVGLEKSLRAHAVPTHSRGVHHNLGRSEIVEVVHETLADDLQYAQGQRTDRLYCVAYWDLLTTHPAT